METTGLPLTKNCDFCNLPHPLTNFHRNKTKQDGLSGTCKQCAIVRSREQRRPILEANRIARQQARSLGPSASKVCSICREEKAISEFHKSGTSWDGHQARCKPCAIAAVVEWQRANPEQVAIRTKKWKAKNPDRVREANNEWRRRLRRDKPELVLTRERGHALKAMGHTLDSYQAQHNQQGGVCAICKQPNNQRRNMAIDHDHSCCGRRKSCGKCLRGLLCAACNTALHKLETVPGWIGKAVAYLEVHAKRE